jgi:ankyrin repeat protein
VIRLLAELGFEVNVWARITPLHQAAYDGDVAVVQTLLDVGADPELRDPGFDATPLGWAEHARRADVIELLRARMRTSLESSSLTTSTELCARKEGGREGP